MRGVVMYAPGDVRVEDRPRADDPEADRRDHPAVGDLHLRVGPVALPRDRGARRADADGSRVRRHRRGGRLGGHHDQAGPVRRRVVLRLRQHLRDLPGRLPDLLRPPRGLGPTGAAQAERMRVPLADGTLVATPEVPAADLVPHFLAASDVLGTGWFAAVAAEAGPGKTVAVVGDGAVGLLGVLAAQQLGAERIIAMSRTRAAPAAGAGVRRHRHRHRTRRRGRGRDQGPDRRPRRALGDRGGRHPGVDDAGHPLHPARRPRRLRRRHPRRVACPARSCSSPTSTCTAAPPRSAGSCPT